MRRALLTLVALLTWVAPAGAATGHKPAGVTTPPHSEQRKLNAYLETARSYWPGSPCAGREVIALDAGPQIAAIAPPEHRDASGWGDPNDCHVYLRAGMEPATFCRVLAHELGHAAGNWHADQGIMRPDVAQSTGPCQDRAALDEYGTAWYATIARLPAAGRGWHVTITRSARRVLVFTAWRRGSIDRKIYAYPATAGEPGYVEGPELTGRRRAVVARRGRRGGATARVGR